jgi:hypothetical protein
VTILRNIEAVHIIILCEEAVRKAQLYVSKTSKVAGMTEKEGSRPLCNMSNGRILMSDELRITEPIQKYI